MSRFKDAPQNVRCLATIKLPDGSKAQCGRFRYFVKYCRQHQKMYGDPREIFPIKKGHQMTRAQSRLNARYAENPCQSTQDAVVGHALHKYHAARITPIHAAVRDHGVYATGRQLCKAGVHFVDAHCAIFGVMPKGSWK